MPIRFIPFLLSLFFLFFQGCSPVKPYPEQKIKNISISTQVDSESFFSNVKADIDIFTISPACKLLYEGTLSLDNNSISTGFAINKEHRLSFVFSSSSLLGNSNSSINYSVYLKPRKGYLYDVIVSYKDNIYNVLLYQTNTKTKKRRKLDTGMKKACKNLQ